jgi:hypothetical protein
MIRRSSSIAGAIFLIVFALFWSSITLLFDGLVLRNLVAQWRAKTHPTTVGRILESTVKTGRGSKGAKSYRPEITYQYEVAGRRYESRRYRHSFSSSSDRTSAQRAVRENPRGAERTVYYDPANPAEAVLDPGIGGADIFMLMFLTPFNGVMLAVWLAVLAGVFSRFRSKEAGGVKLRRERGQTIARLPGFAPLTAALFTFCLGSFIGIFAVAFTGGGFNPSLPRVLTAWGVVAFAAIAVFVHRRLRLSSGAEDLVVDPGYATVTLPLTHGRKLRESIPFNELKSVEVREHVQRGRKGGTTRTWQVWLVRKNGADEQLHVFGMEEDAQSFAEWLRSQTGARSTAEVTS